MDASSLLQAVFDSTADGILIIDNDGKVVQYNKRFVEMWGFSSDVLDSCADNKLIEHILSQVIYPDRFTEKIKQLYRDPESVSTDTIEFKDGRFFERFSRPLKIDNTTVGRVWSFRDVSRQKKSEEFFSAIAQLSPDILSLMDEKGTIIFNSAAAERIHGYRSEELVGRNTFELIHEEDRGRVFDAMNRLLRDEIIDSIQYRYLNKDQTWSWMEATGSNQIHNPLIQGLVVVSREVGKRKKLEDDLSQALKERDEFFTIASHELRTPITSIKMQLQMLQRYKNKLKSDDDIERKYEDIDRLMEQIQSVQRLIDDILSVSRIRTGQLSYEIEVINFSDLLKNTLKNFSEIFLEAGCSLDIQIEEGVLISGDKTRLNQVFFNLMNNAVKYSPGKLIKISLNQKSDIAEFRIQDHGYGIPADKIDRIFGLFERGDRKEIISGLGIGLYISRNIVETHKGTIQVESELGKGATFIVQIPTA